MKQIVKVNSVTTPPRRPNLIDWMTKHNVSSSVTSLDFATTRAIESEQEEYEVTHMTVKDFTEEVVKKITKRILGVWK